MIGKVPAFLLINHSAESGIYQQNNLAAIMKGTFGILIALILSGVLCSCSQKEGPSATPTPTPVPVSAIILNPTSLTLTEGETATITATVSPSNADNQKVIWSSSDASVATVSDGKVTGKSKGAAIISAIADDNGKTAQCSISVNAKSNSGGSGDSGNSITAVDLGLSVKWANCNLGANSVEGYGDYYAWGETETKNYYSWSNYKWCEGSENTLTKYNTNKNYGVVDNKGVLSAEDDVAHVKLGGEWHIPTRAEWEELRAGCEWTWTTHNLVPGALVMAENGNSLFLPAAGIWGDSTLDNKGIWGYYYSASLYESWPASTWMLRLSPSYPGEMIDGNYYRSQGMSIRPVYGAATLTGDNIIISVLVLSSSDCTVSLSTSSTKTYYTAITRKSYWDKYGAESVVSEYIDGELNYYSVLDRPFSECLFSGNRSYDRHGLSPKTEYVAFASFCDSNGVRSGDIYSKTFTTK